MAASAAIRLQIETALAKRVPAALILKIKQAPELFSTGIEEIDAVLGGGIPRGSITEIAGAASTGKTSFALSSIAAITQSGAACAWVDVSDALSPESAAAAQVVMKRLLWLRMSSDRKKPAADKPWSRLEQALAATDLLLQAGGFAAIVLDMSDVRPQDATRIPVATLVSLSACRRTGPHCTCAAHADSMRQELLCTCSAFGTLQRSTLQPQWGDGLIRGTTLQVDP